MWSRCLNTSDFGQDQSAQRVIECNISPVILPESLSEKM